MLELKACLDWLSTVVFTLARLPLDHGSQRGKVRQYYYTFFFASALRSASELFLQISALAVATFTDLQRPEASVLRFPSCGHTSCNFYFLLFLLI